MWRSPAVAIHRPAAPAGTAIRIRKSGFSQEAGTPEIWPEKCASPCVLSGTEVVSSTDCVAVPALQIKVPVTAVTGPGVPLELLPLRTKPSTSKNVFPLDRFTRACPLRTDQGPAPA